MCPCRPRDVCAIGKVEIGGGGVWSGDDCSSEAWPASCRLAPRPQSRSTPPPPRPTHPGCPCAFAFWGSVCLCPHSWLSSPPKVVAQIGICCAPWVCVDLRRSVRMSGCMPVDVEGLGDRTSPAPSGGRSGTCTLRGQVIFRERLFFSVPRALPNGAVSASARPQWRGCSRRRESCCRGALPWAWGPRHGPPSTRQAPIDAPPRQVYFSFTDGRRTARHCQDAINVPTPVAARRPSAPRRRPPPRTSRQRRLSCRGGAFGCRFQERALLRRG